MNCFIPTTNFRPSSIEAVKKLDEPCPTKADCSILLFPSIPNKDTHCECLYLVLAGDVGIEPTSAVLETAVLPLNESPMRGP